MEYLEARVSLIDPAQIVVGPKPFGGRRHVVQADDGQVAEFWTWPDGRVYVARILRVCQSPAKEVSE